MSKPKSNNQVMVWNQRFMCYNLNCLDQASVSHIHCFRCGKAVYKYDFTYRGNGTRTRHHRYYCKDCWNSMWR